MLQMYTLSLIISQIYYIIIIKTKVNRMIVNYIRGMLILNTISYYNKIIILCVRILGIGIRFFVCILYIA